MSLKCQILFKSCLLEMHGIVIKLLLLGVCGVHVFYISNQFISNQYSALKILSNFSTGSLNIKQLDFFYEAMRNGWSFEAQTKWTRIKWKLYYKKSKQGVGDLKMTKTEETYTL